jgi:HK97 family phage major capsid protein
MDFETITKQLTGLDGNVSEVLKEAKVIQEANKALELQIKSANDELTKKGADILHMQEEIKGIREKQGSQILQQINNKALTMKDAVLLTLTENWDAFKSRKSMEEVRMVLKVVGDMTAALNLTGNVVATYDLDVAIRGRRLVHVRDLIPTVSSGTGYFKYYRSNTPPGEGAFASNGVGVTKAQLDYDLTEVIVTTSYIAGFARVAKEMAQDLPFISTFVPQELQEDFLRMESDMFAAQIQANSTAAPAAGTNYAESIINMLAALAKNDRAANGIVVNPDGWANILKTKPSDYSVPGGVVISPQGQILIAGVPLYQANWVGLVGKGIVADWNQIYRVETDPLSLASSDIEGNNFVQNKVTYRLECREALTVRRPDAVIYGTL